MGRGASVRRSFRACKMPASKPLLILACVAATAPSVASAASVRRQGADLEGRAVRSLLEIRRDRVVMQQWDTSCGAAALATVLTYTFGDPVPEKTIAEAMLKRTEPLRVKARGGFSLLDLKRYAEERGYQASGYSELTVEDLIEFGAAIVPIRIHGYNHFVVFKGIEDGRVLLADPAWGNRKMRVESFKKAWLQNLGFVVSRPGASNANMGAVGSPDHSGSRAGANG